jgi:hypothetical protein
MSRFNGQIGFIEPQLATLVDQPLNIVVIAGLTLALVACVSSDERGQQVAADHKTCLNEGEPGSTGYQNCREELMVARRQEARERGPERALHDR